MDKKYVIGIIMVMGSVVVAYFLGSSYQNQKQTENQSITSRGGTKTATNPDSQPQFLGETGESVNLLNGRVSIAPSPLNDNLAHYYHTTLPNGKIIYFFVVKDRAGVYRAAANACQVCYDARMGFRQEGNFMVCNTCGNRYPLEKIATEKGGCNPGPINPNIKVENGNLIIDQQDLEQVALLF